MASLRQQQDWEGEGCAHVLCVPAPLHMVPVSRPLATWGYGLEHSPVLLATYGAIASVANTQHWAVAEPRPTAPLPHTTCASSLSCTPVGLWLTRGHLEQALGPTCLLAGCWLVPCISLSM